MSLRLRFLPAMGACAVLVLAGLAWPYLPGSASSVAPWLLACAGLALPLIAFEGRVRRPLQDLAGAGRVDEIDALHRRIEQASEALTAKQTELAAVLAQRQQIDLALREHEQRYVLAVQGANDGLWEWELASGAMYLSPRWKSMLGYDIDGVSNRIDTWKSLVHADDIAATETALRDCIEGGGERFDIQHRMRAADGRYRWIATRGTLMRRASGAPYRMIGHDTDISNLHRLQEILQHVSQGIAGATGDAFFRQLVRHFAAVVGVQQAFITECVDFPTTRVRPLAAWHDGGFIEDPEYDLARTPCEEVIQANRMVYVPEGIEQRFTCSALQGFTSYLGIPIPDSNGRVIGHLAFQGPEPIREEVATETIYRIFIARAAAEMERRHDLNALTELAGRLSRRRGDAAFAEMARYLADLTGLREAFVTECLDEAPRRVRMLSWWRDGEFRPPIEYDIAGSACEEALVQGHTCHRRDGVRAAFNYGDDPGWECYLGIPCLDSEGRVIGHVAAADRRPMTRALPNDAILMLLSERAALEIQRRRLERGMAAISTTTQAHKAPLPS